MSIDRPVSLSEPDVTVNEDTNYQIPLLDSVEHSVVKVHKERWYIYSDVFLALCWSKYFV
jgi:hypothetical protein